MQSALRRLIGDAAPSRPPGVALLCLALLCGVAGPVVSATVESESASCDPSRMSCVPGEGNGCTTAKEALGLCLPPGSGGGEGGGSCTPAAGGDTSCGGAGPASVGGGAGGGVQVGGGNPINLVSGNKYQEEVDLPPLPGVLGLELKRYYNSRSSHAGLMGNQWRMSYETVLVDHGSQIQIVQADGRRLSFQRGPGVRAHLCTSPSPQDGQVRIEGSGGERTYHWRWPDGRTLSFGGGSGGGHPLQAITAASGQRLTLSYSPQGELIQVRDPQGRKLSFIYGRRTLRAIATPLGLLRYTQDAQGRLTEVASGKDEASAPAQTRLYHYEDRYNGGHAGALTGISLRSLDPETHRQIEQRLSTFAYDPAGRAMLSTKGIPRQSRDGKPVQGTGIEQIEVQYIDKALPFEGRPDKNGEVIPRQLGKAILSNSLGQKTEVLSAVIGGAYRLIQMKGPGCATCGPGNMRYGYNTEGQLIRATQLDEQGRPLASQVMQYDRHGRIQRLGRQAYLQGRPQPVQWRRRFEYTDTRFKDGSIAMAPRPSLIVQPSVVPGREMTTTIEYGPSASAFANLPVKITQRGWSPVVPAPGTTGKPSANAVPQSIARSIGARYVADGAAAGQIMEIDGPLPGEQDTTRVTYTARDARSAQGDVIPPGLPLTVAYPEGLGERRDYDGIGRVILHLPVDGVAVAYAYDAPGPRSGLLTTRTTRAGLTTRTTYDESGQIASSAGADGLATRFTHDLAHRMTRVSDGNGYRVETMFDTEGHTLRQQWFEPQAAGPLRANYRWYDDAGRLQGSLRADGWLDRYEYVAGSQKAAKHVDGLLNATYWLGGPAARANATVRIGHDGSLSAVIGDPATEQVVDHAVERPRLVQTRSDDFGRTVWVKLAQHGQRWARYDEAGRLTEMRFSDGGVTRYRRDALGRLTQKQTFGPRPSQASDDTDRADDTVTLTYDGGALSRVTDAAQRTEFKYDPAGRIVERCITLIRTSDPAGESPATALASYALRYAYDPVTGKLTRQQLADGRTLYTAYDPRTGAANSLRLSAASIADRFGLNKLWGGEGSSLALLTDIRVHPFNGFAAATSGNGIETLYGHDIAGRLTSIQVAGVLSVSYGYGTGPQIREQRQQWQGLTPDGSAVANPALRQASYRYDTWGRWRTDKAGLPRAERYDSRGRLIADGLRSYRYNGQGRLIEVRQATTGRLIARYAYNAWGERVSKTVFGTAADTQTTYYLYEASRLAAEIDRDGRVMAQYLYANGSPYAKLESETAGTRARNLYIHTDARGTPLAMTDQERRLVWSSQDALEDQAWGRMSRILQHASPASGWQRLLYQGSGGRWGQADLAPATLNLRLAGQYHDPETGLHYNYQRYYDPATGRYLTPDPAGYRDGPDAYAYVHDDPVNKTDALGLYQSDIHYYMTFFLAVVAGVQADDARTIALAAQYIDDNPDTRPLDDSTWLTAAGSVFENQQRLLDYHFVLSDQDGTNGGRKGKTNAQFQNDDVNADVLASPQLSRLFAASDKAPTQCAQWQFLGEALHAFEDTFSHRNEKNTPYDALQFGLGVGHGLAGSNPDYTYNHPSFLTDWNVNENRTLQMELAVYDKLQAHGTPGGKVDGVELVVFLAEFNAVQENSGNTDEYGSKVGSKKKIGDSVKIQLLNDKLEEWGFKGINLLDARAQGYDSDEAAANRRNNLCNKENTRLRQEDYPGTILPKEGCPI